MKPVSSAVLSMLTAYRASGTADMQLSLANLYTITLIGGTILTTCDIDVPVTWNGYTYAANSVLISGLKYKCALGVNVDSQKIGIDAKITDTIGGIPFMQALRQGLFDGAFIQRERAFFATLQTQAPVLTPIGTVILFKGRVSQIDSIGRTSAEVTVASDLVLLDIDMPRNLYQPNCSHVLFDAGCGLNRATYTSSGAVGAGSTLTQINWAGASAAHQQGAITFTTGANAGAEATVKTASSGSLILAYPLQYAPASGDAFTICQGCDHTMATCQSKFANLGNFRGFPFVPPPQIMTGPTSSTYTSGK